jgi:hypothetical protein
VREPPADHLGTGGQLLHAGRWLLSEAVRMSWLWYLIPVAEAVFFGVRLWLIARTGK